MFELWFGTPNEMQIHAQDQTPGPIRKKAKDHLEEILRVVSKFEPERVPIVRSVKEEIHVLILSDIRPGEPFRRTFDYMGLVFVIEIRRIK